MNDWGFKYILLIDFLFLGLTGNIFAQERQALPVAAINSEYDELMPVIAPDGKTLYFVRTGHPGNIGGETAGQDIWYSQKHSGKDEWQSPQNPGAPLNNIYNNAISSLSPDGQGMWLNNIYRVRNRMAPGASYATKTNAGWSKPEAVTIRNFTPETGFLNFYQATDSILFLSAQTDTTNLEDIFICRRVGEKEWSAPERVSELNTPGFEIAPVLAPDRRTLYFTSNGHGGFGDADIFMCRRLDNTWLNWSEPENLGAAVNTAGFDGYFTLDNTSGMAYFTRENQNNNTDIYYIALAYIPPPKNMVAKMSPLTKKQPEASPVEESGTKQFIYQVPVFFEVNSAEINRQYHEDLKNLGKSLKAVGSSVIIQGHADDTGAEITNNFLSEQRARAVGTFLKEQGLAENLINIKAFGSRQPAVPNQSDETRARNRRVEIQIK